MKKLLILVIAGSFFSCSKGDEATPPLPPKLSGTIVFDEEHSELGLGSYHAVNVYKVEEKKLSKIIFPFEPGQNINYNDPYLSANGSKIIVQSNHEGQDYQYIMNLDGSNLQKITYSGNVRREMQHTPDGNRFMYLKQDAKGDEQIMFSDLNGSNEKAVTSFDLPSNPVFVSNLVWTKTNQPIYFNSTLQSSRTNIYSINPDGSNLKRISVEDKSEFLCDVSPDGKQILSYASAPGGGVEIFITNSDGTNKKQLTNFKKISADACFSPDGNYICFTSDKEVADPANPRSITDYYIMKLDGTELQRISDEQSVSWFADWK
jgi:Tol biopolymer transport system component